MQSHILYINLWHQYGHAVSLTLEKFLNFNLINKNFQGQF